MLVETRHQPEYTFTSRDRWGRPVPHTVEAHDFQFAPTMARVHELVHGDWGPFYISWHDGWLCPFDSQVSNKNMRCVEGKRGVMRCPGIGLALESDHIKHMSKECQRTLKGRVICYEWAHRLSRSYWDYMGEAWDSVISALPDDVMLVFSHIVREVYNRSGWFEWKRELDKRKRLKGKFDADYRLLYPESKWLKQLPTRK